jgi:hypothetical protein
MITMMFVVGKLARDNGHVTKTDLLPVRMRDHISGSATLKKLQTMKESNLHLTASRFLCQACATAAPHDEDAQTQCYYEAYVRKHVLETIGMSNSGFLPPSSVYVVCAKI